jgi:hypothetical protein
MMPVVSTVFLPLASYRSYPMYWDMNSVMTHVGVVTIAGLLLWLAINRVGWLLKNRQRYGQTHPALFTELCQAHVLTRASRALLTQISQTLPPNQCCRVFIDAQIIDKYAQTNPADAEDCFELARRLYGVQSR